MCAADPRRRSLAFGLGLAAGLGPLAGCAQPTGTPPGPGMTPSVTYLHLLAKVPFFAALSREQLQWVIDHSREWAAAAGAEIATFSRGGDSFWVLLDGGWRIEQGDRSVSAGHADPAKWYGGRDMLALGGSTRLVATARSRHRWAARCRSADGAASRRAGNDAAQGGRADHRRRRRPTCCAGTARPPRTARS